MSFCAEFSCVEFVCGERCGWVAGFGGKDWACAASGLNPLNAMPAPSAKTSVAAVRARELCIENQVKNKK
jgi:hypothetical protein